MTGPRASRRTLFRWAGITAGVLVVSGASTSATAAPKDDPPVAPVKVTGWGGCDLVRGVADDRLTLELVIPVAAKAKAQTATKKKAKQYEQVELTGLEVFGARYTVYADSLIRDEAGKFFPYELSGALSYNDENKTLALDASGRPGTITVIGARFDPPAGIECPELLLTGNSGVNHKIRVPARKFRKIDHAPQREQGPIVMAALRKFSEYLDRRQTATGGWLIASPGHEAKEDPQAIAGIATGYMQTHHLTGDPAHEARAKRALDWLVNNQQPGGGFGFPWIWGRASSHFSPIEHYENGLDHPVGFPYSVNTLNAGIALLTGYEVFKDPRYLAAARKVRDFATSEDHGVQWLDTLKTRGSIPYCNKLPVVAPDHPALVGRDVVPAVRNSSVEIYNIDSFGIRFLDRLRQMTGEERLSRYVKAMVTNIKHRIEEDGAISYSWIQLNKPDYYTYAVAAALARYATDHNDQQAFEATRAMMSWRTNAWPPGAILNEMDGVTLLGLDNSLTPVGYAKYATSTQLPDGDWSGTKNTRGDVDKMNSMSYLLVQAGYREKKSRSAVPASTFELMVSDPVSTVRKKRK